MWSYIPHVATLHRYTEPILPRLHAQHLQMYLKTYSMCYPVLQWLSDYVLNNWLLFVVSFALSSFGSMELCFLFCFFLSSLSSFFAFSRSSSFFPFQPTNWNLCQWWYTTANLILKGIPVYSMINSSPLDRRTIFTASKVAAIDAYVHCFLRTSFLC